MSSESLSRDEFSRPSRTCLCQGGLLVGIRTRSQVPGPRVLTAIVLLTPPWRPLSGSCRQQSPAQAARAGQRSRVEGWRRGRPPATALPPVRGPGCPCLPGGRWKRSSRVVPGRGASCSGQAPLRLLAQARSSDLRPAVREPGVTPSPHAPSTLGCHTPLLAAPPPGSVCVCGEGSEVQGLLLASPLHLPPPGYQRRSPHSAWPRRRQMRLGRLWETRESREEALSSD